MVVVLELYTFYICMLKAALLKQIGGMLSGC